MNDDYQRRLDSWARTRAKHIREQVEADRAPKIIQGRLEMNPKTLLLLDADTCIQAVDAKADKTRRHLAFMDSACGSDYVAAMERLIAIQEATGCTLWEAYKNQNQDLLL